MLYNFFKLNSFLSITSLLTFQNCSKIVLISKTSSIDEPLTNSRFFIIVKPWKKCLTWPWNFIFEAETWAWAWGFLKWVNFLLTPGRRERPPGRAGWQRCCPGVHEISQICVLFCEFSFPFYQFFVP